MSIYACSLRSDSIRVMERQDELAVGGLWRDVVNQLGSLGCMARALAEPEGLGG